MINNMYEIMFKRFYSELIGFVAKQHPDEELLKLLIEEEIADRVIQDVLKYITYTMPLEGVVIQFAYTHSENEGDDKCLN